MRCPLVGRYKTCCASDLGRMMQFWAIQALLAAGTDFGRNESYDFAGAMLRRQGVRCAITKSALLKTLRGNRLVIGR